MALGLSFVLPAVAAEQQRIVEFPAQSLGGLYTVKVDGFSSVEKSLGRAQGRVRLPVGKNVGLSASYTLVGNMNLLKAIPTDLLFEFALDRIECEGEKPIDISSVGRFSGLRRLLITDCTIDDESTAALANLHELNYLKIWYSSISGKHLIDLPHPEKMLLLEIGLNPLKPEAFDGIARMTHLKVLRVAKSGVNDAALAKLANLSELEDLNIGGNPDITIRGLKQLHKLKKLRSLDYSDCRAGIDKLLALKGLPLKFLVYSGNMLTRADLVKLRKALPDVILDNRDKVDERTKYVFGPLHY